MDVLKKELNRRVKTYSLLTMVSKRFQQERGSVCHHLGGLRVMSCWHRAMGFRRGDVPGAVPPKKKTAPKYAATQMSIRNPALVIPAEAGIQAFQSVLDPGFRRGDGSAIGYFIVWSCTKGCLQKSLCRLVHCNIQSLERALFLFARGYPGA